MEAFAKSDYYTNESQDSDVADQILPVFLIAFFASLVNSLFLIKLNSTETDTSTGIDYINISYRILQR